jgi:GNAT superfamily N-acetyltransferase
MTVRPAHPGEAELLTRIALRSKAHWGYDAAFMQACVPALTLTPARLQAEPFFVADEDGRVVGFSGLRIVGDEAELTYLFVEPDAIRRGYGRRLWCHAVALACAQGARRIRIESDPFAEPFYRAMGAARVGEAASEAIPDRMIPLLVFALPHATDVALEMPQAADRQSPSCDRARPLVGSAGHCCARTSARSPYQ